jgi:hypothetical protein
MPEQLFPESLLMPNARPHTQCALCLQPKKLEYSHIIPEFLYESLYDDKHRFHVLSLLPDKRNSMEQKGLREHLLCRECEQRLSKWESYASLVLKDGIGLTLRRDRDIVHVGGFHYEKFRLFQLAVLWRASVSNLEFFENVNLAHHAESLRQTLLSATPGATERYGCLMFRLELQGAAFTQVIMPPSKLRFLGHTAYRFVFPGFMWVYLESAYDECTPYTDWMLQPTGKALFLIKDALEMQDLASFSRELVGMGRRP